MTQLLDRYRRLADGKEFAVVALGALTKGTVLSVAGRSLTLEAEDGERVESPPPVKGLDRFERIVD